ncbi:MAG: type 4a pilus biogenesis protein PilO [Kofleriaceae bacterium]
MAGALADFSRRPPRYRAAVYLGVAGALGLLYYQFGLSPLRKAVKDAEEERSGAVSEARKLDKQKQERDKLIEDQAALKEQIEGNESALPTEAAMPAFIELINRRATEAGVQGKRREEKREIAVDNFVKSPVEFELTGSYYQLTQFFASLRVRPVVAADGANQVIKDRIVTVEDLSVFDPRVVNNSLVLTAKFTASTFRGVAPAAPAAAAAPAPGAAAPTPATPTPAAPAKPASSTEPATAPAPLTPARAKAAVEDSNAAAEARAQAAATADDAKPTPGVDRVKGGL